MNMTGFRVASADYAFLLHVMASKCATLKSVKEM